MCGVRDDTWCVCGSAHGIPASLPNSQYGDLAALFLVHRCSFFSICRV